MDLAHPIGKAYVYDCLYYIHDLRVEKAKSGFNVFKHKSGVYITWSYFWGVFDWRVNGWAPCKITHGAHP